MRCTYITHKATHRGTNFNLHRSKGLLELGLLERRQSLFQSSSVHFDVPASLSPFLVPVGTCIHLPHYTTREKEKKKNLPYRARAQPCTASQPLTRAPIPPVRKSANMRSTGGALSACLAACPSVSSPPSLNSSNHRHSSRPAQISMRIANQTLPYSSLPYLPTLLEYLPLTRKRKGHKCGLVISSPRSYLNRTVRALDCCYILLMSKRFQKIAAVAYRPDPSKKAKFRWHAIAVLFENASALRVRTYILPLACPVRSGPREVL